jgi:hypothetical protein
VRLLVACPSAPTHDSRIAMKTALVVVAVLAAAWIAGVPHALHVATETLIAALP